MTRRHFLATLTAAVAATTLPLAMTPTTPTIATICPYQRNCTRWVQRKYRP